MPTAMPRLTTCEKPRWSVRSVLAPMVLALMSGTALAQSPAPTERPRYDVYWEVVTDAMDLQHGSRVDWARSITMGGARVNTNFWTIYEDVLSGDVRVEGLHITRRADFRDKFAKRLQRELDARIPADVEGLGCLDIEFLPFEWGNRTGGPGLRPGAPAATRASWDKWYDYIRTERPDLIAGKSTAQAEDVLDRTYSDAVRDYVSMCLQEAKRLRPKLKWGMYGYPLWRNQEYGYPEPNPYKQGNDKLKWLWDMSDVAFTSLYQPRKVVADGTPISDPERETTHSFNRQFMRTNIQEARRCIGPDKLVVPYVMLRHPEYTGPLAEQWLNSANLSDSIEYPKSVGADGVVVWGIVANGADKTAWQSYIDTNFAPMAIGVVSEAAAPRRQPASAGSQGGSGGGSVPTPPGAGGNPPVPPARNTVAQARQNAGGAVRQPRQFAGGTQPQVARPAVTRVLPATPARAARPNVDRIVVVPNN